jgi:hypothetical protein
MFGLCGEDLKVGSRIFREGRWWTVVELHDCMNAVEVEP